MHKVTSCNFIENLYKISCTLAKSSLQSRVSKKMKKISNFAYHLNIFGTPRSESPNTLFTFLLLLLQKQFGVACFLQAFYNHLE